MSGDEKALQPRASARWHEPGPADRTDVRGGRAFAPSGPRADARGRPGSPPTGHRSVRQRPLRMSDESGNMSDNRRGSVMDRINFRVDQKIKRELEAQARARGVKPSEIVREALVEHLNRRNQAASAHDLAVRAGILGSLKGLPPDLSTNPAHMEGFGRD